MGGAVKKGWKWVDRKWEGVKDKAEDTWGEVKDGVSYYGKELGKATKKAIKDAIKFHTDILGKPLSWAGECIGGRAGNLLKATGGFIQNGGNYLGNALGNLAEGVITGHGNQIEGAGKELLALGTAALAIASGNPYAIASSLVYLDTLFNQGALLGSTLDIASDIEQKVFKSDKINKERENIELAINALASIGVFYGASLTMSSMLSSAPSWLNNTLNLAGAGAGAYDVKKKYEWIRDREEEYKRKFQEYLAELRRLEALVYEAKRQFFELITGGETYRYFAGGDLYNASMAGARYYAPLTLNEPYAAILAYIKPDKAKYSEINSYATGRLYESLAGNSGYLYSVDSSMKWG
ncbi:MAG: hypothetical protein ACTTH5_02990 [Wolinella sp.]